MTPDNASPMGRDHAHGCLAGLVQWCPHCGGATDAPAPVTTPIRLPDPNLYSPEVQEEMRLTMEGKRQ